MAHRPRLGSGTSRRASVLCIAGSIAALAACADESGLSNVRPLMTLNPEPGTTIGFGEVVLGRTTVEPRTIRVGNIGEGPLVISRVVVEGEAAAMFRVTAFPRTVAPGAAKDIYIRFEPTQKIDATATLRILSNDPTRPDVTFPVTGPAREPCALAMSPPHSQLKLGEIRNVTVTAAGSQDCTITYLFTDQTIFPFINAPETPFTVPAGTSIDLQVQHSGLPRSPGIPIRQILAKESEGTEKTVSLEGEPPISSCLDVYPRRLLFDQTVIDRTSSQRVTVRNDCMREAYVTSALITIGTYYYDVDEAEFPTRVAPGGTTDVTVTYKMPFSPLGDDGRLILNTNDASFPRFEVELFGTAAVPAITFFPALLDFGTVVFKNPQGAEMRSECSSSSQFVQVYNAGTAPLTIRSLEIDPTADHQFEINGVLVDGLPLANFAMPFEVPPDKDAKISIQFYPTRVMPAEHQSTLTIDHNAPDTAPAVVTLRGRASDVGATTDTFTQLTGPKVDILWVIDNSCSMFNEQAALIQNLGQFVGHADSLDADYQMAIITTDGHSPASGTFEDCNPYPRVIASGWGTEAERQSAFSCLFNVGTDGPGNEAGIAAAKNALELAQSPDQDPIRNKNAGFLRSDANLAIVVVSDEDDSSDEGDRLLRDYFLSIKGSTRPDRIKFHSIIGPVDGPCESGPTQAQPGLRYYWMSRQLGGLVQSICLEDWQPTLTNLGLETFTPLNEWTLSQLADPGTLIVTVDGVPVAMSATDGVTFNSTANSVQFHGGAVPLPGQEIVVGYEGLCRP